MTHLSSGTEILNGPALVRFWKKIWPSEDVTKYPRQRHGWGLIPDKCQTPLGELLATGETFLELLVEKQSLTGPWSWTQDDDGASASPVVREREYFPNAHSYERPPRNAMHEDDDEDLRRAIELSLIENRPLDDETVVVHEQLEHMMPPHMIPAAHMAALESHQPSPQGPQAEHESVVDSDLDSYDLYLSDESATRVLNNQLRGTHEMIVFEDYDHNGHDSVGSDAGSDEEDDLD